MSAWGIVLIVLGVIALFILCLSKGEMKERCVAAI